MKITTDFIRDRFNTFNRLCFDGQLPLPTFRLSNVRTYLGQMRKKETGWRLWRKHTEYTLTINTGYDMDEQEVEDVILHEMIHYYIMWKGLRDSSAHGTVFRSMMQQINNQYNRRISISSKKHRQPDDYAGKKRRHIVCVVKLQTGEQGIIIPPRTRIQYFYRQLKRISTVTDCRWYMSNDPYFNRFPHPRSVKVYRISREELQTHLENAERIDPCSADGTPAPR